ncbi:MAG: hypothetical protein ACTSUB_05430 [Candidatus Thorarchaeota archaeon]
MRISSDRTQYAFTEPEITPSILANIPDCLRSMLENSARLSKQKRKSVLISSNSLANRFILDRWAIRPSQRRRFNNLFSAVRKQCRNIFQHLLAKGRMEWTDNDQSFIFGVYKFDEVRGNLILGFVEVSPDNEWTLPTR